MFQSNHFLVLKSLEILTTLKEFSKYEIYTKSKFNFLSLQLNILIYIMKKVLVILTLFFSFCAFSQEINFGLRLGGNLATIDTKIVDSRDLNSDTPLDFTGVFGYQAGVFACIKLSDNFALQPELNYSLQGGQNETENYYFGVKEYQKKYFKLNYLTIPVMARVFILEKLTLEVGPQIGVLLQANQNIETKVSKGSLSTVTSKSENLYSDFMPLEFSANFGVGFEVSKHFGVGLRYSRGIMVIDRSLTGIDYKNNVISLYSTLKF